jgi:hypothetical protein
MLIRLFDDSSIFMHTDAPRGACTTASRIAYSGPKIPGVLESLCFRNNYRLTARIKGSDSRRTPTKAFLGVTERAGDWFSEFILIVPASDQIPSDGNSTHGIGTVAVRSDLISKLLSNRRPANQCLRRIVLRFYSGNSIFHRA